MAMMASLASRFARSVSLVPCHCPVVPSLASGAPCLGPPRRDQQQQVRSKVTKTKRRRLAKKRKKAAMAERGIYPPKPPFYTDIKEPVKNAIPKDERVAQARAAEEIASQELQDRMAGQAQGAEPLRFHMEGLRMSDRVRKLFELTNGNQYEVIKAQKERGMELFQLREGDTGSSAVQVIALTTRIQQLQTHFRTHKKDYSGKRGLDALYVRRRKLLDYMERKEFDSYRKVVKTLGLVR